jgi:hypothetical protein
VTQPRDRAGVWRMVAEPGARARSSGAVPAVGAAAQADWVPAQAQHEWLRGHHCGLFERCVKLVSWLRST